MVILFCMKMLAGYQVSILFVKLVDSNVSYKVAWRPLIVADWAGGSQYWWIELACDSWEVFI